MAIKQPRKSSVKREVERRKREETIDLYDKCIKEACGDSFNNINVTTCIVEAFIICIKRFKENNEAFEYTQFSKAFTLKLFNSYNKAVSSKLSQIKERYFPYIRSMLVNLYGKDNVKEFLLEVETRIVIHVKNPYMSLEIGISWHPIFNIPYIPATSIKGLMRSYLELKREELKEKNIELTICGKDIDEIFGKGGKEGMEGLVIFHDALPIEPGPNECLIEPEIVNPHYSESKNALREIDVRPTPIVYPAIATGTKFKLITVFRDKIFAQKSCFEEFSNHFNEALQEGIGAKVRLGYGIVKIVKIR